MQQITEEMKIHQEWYKEAHDLTLDQLPEFLNRLMNEYHHDYGTICHALAAGAIATMYAMDHHKQGGITGFQAGCIMWEFIRQWNYTDNKTGLRILDYDNMLYPQYEYKFSKFISPDIWKSLRKEAASRIQQNIDAEKEYAKRLQQYEVDLAAFVEKYPDYYERREYYERLSCGAEDDWNKEHEKEKSGFEFAPRQPYCESAAGPVFDHWKSIVDGMVPFGYVVKEV